MRVLVALVVLVACVQLAVAYTPSATPEQQFEAFMQTYNRTYGSAEEKMARFDAFMRNLQYIKELRTLHEMRTGQNADGIYGITKFADLTAAEFKARYMGYRPSIPVGHPTKAPVAEPKHMASPPAKFDWRSKKPPVVSPVKNQEQCGSCWAFSATEEVESSWAMEGHPLIELSVQQIVSCDTVDGGCNGGDTISAYQYIEQAGGLELDSAYPYTSGGGDSGTCMFNASGVQVTVASYSYATPGCTGNCDNQNLDLLLDNLYSHGPVSICVYAEPWQVYTGGILSSGCPHAYSDLDHCVQLVGYDKSGSDPYWIIRNSWGTDWGENGYIYVSIAGNTCGVADEATLVKTIA